MEGLGDRRVSEAGGAQQKAEVVLQSSTKVSPAFLNYGGEPQQAKC